MVNKVYELPGIENAVRYLHAAAGFPTKATWLKAKRKGNYLSWPIINVKNVNKNFPEYEETQKGHMHNQRQGVQSTKSRQAGQSSKYKRGDQETDESAAQIPSGDTHEVIEKKQDIFIALYDPKDTMYTNQRGEFLVSSSQGQQYQVVSHHIHSNCTLAETTK